MPSLEEICQRIFSDAQFWNKLLIGGLLSFIPVLNIFALGYLYQYSLNVRRNGEFTLPVWRQWQGLFWHGLPFLGLLVLFFVLPLGVGWLLSYLLRFLIGLGILSFLPLGLALLLGPAFTMAALHCYQTQARFEDLLKIHLIFNKVLSGWKHMVLPLLAYTGLILVGLPLIGFAFFLGFVVLIAYCNVVFLVLEKESKA